MEVVIIALTFCHLELGCSFVVASAPDCVTGYRQLVAETPAGYELRALDCRRVTPADLLQPPPAEPHDRT